jgi:hypothetical protein
MKTKIPSENSKEHIISTLQEIDQKLDYIITMIREEDLKYPHHGHYLDDSITDSRKDR